jgi:ParB family chromosome partitioning protein
LDDQLKNKSENLDKLIIKSNSSNDKNEKKQEILELPINSIVPNPRQPRKVFDEKFLKELSVSIKNEGVIQPIIVSKSGLEGKFLLIAGERRWRATQIAGLTTIPAVLREASDRNLLKLALIENIQRQDLNIIEEAEAYRMLILDQGITQEECADLVGRDRATVANYLRILNLPREVQDDVSVGRLSMGHGKALLGLDQPKQILKCREMILKRSLNVRQTEQLVQSIRKKKNINEKADLGEDPDLSYLAEMLRSFFQTRIKITGKPSKGRIEISYFSTSELERILKLMGHPMSE